MKAIWSESAEKAKMVGEKPRIAVCFFGITRSLSFTMESIEQQVLGPAGELADMRSYGHFFCQGEIVNPRSGERGVLNQGEHTLLHLDMLELETPDYFLEEMDFDFFKSFGDHWGDEFRSLRNMFHQLRSLRKVTRAALRDDPDIYIFVRPDLLYHDSFCKIIELALESSAPTVFLPGWSSSFARLNDRFAVCAGREAAIAYGFRVDRLREFCVMNRASPQPNRLVKYALDRAKIRYQFIKTRASRVRFDGRVVKENFTPKRLKEVKKIMAKIRKRFAGMMRAGW